MSASTAQEKRSGFNPFQFRVKYLISLSFCPFFHYFKACVFVIGHEYCENNEEHDCSKYSDYVFCHVYNVPG